MTVTEPFSFTRYLAAKKSVDDRSLNRNVWDTLAGQLSRRATPLRVLEVGAGIGTMVARAVEWELFQSEVFYTAIDDQPDNIAEAHRYLTDWAAGQGIKTVGDTPSSLRLNTGRSTIHTSFHTTDAFAYIDTEIEPASYDLLIANAFIDLVHIPTALPVLFSTLKPGGLFYFTITFDGVTAFEPLIDAELDALIEALYHADMEKRCWEDQPTGGSHAGRRLLRYLFSSDTEVLAAGASDWIVTPRTGGYHADEAAFLHAIIHTIDGALTGHPELPNEQLAAWVERRHRQIDDGKLVYLAHQLDVLGRV
jgi:SAM-dependent methyltransferase